MAITIADIKKLRDMTAAGMMDCKKALIEANGDFQKAVDIIREKGKLVAAKRGDRETSEGAVRARVQNGKAILVCVGCETDFVSATPGFKALVDEVADAAIASMPKDADALKEVKCANGYTVDQEISAQAGKTGEKHVLAYYGYLEAPYISEYVHFNFKTGAIVAFNKEIPAEAGRAIAQQVTAMAPISVNQDDCPQEAIDKELEIYKAQMADDPKMAGKPAAMLENIAKGKLAKFFKEHTLEQQAFVQDEKISVADYLKSVDKDVKVLGFKRFNLND
jgi:elongation factor Ts